MPSAKCDNAALVIYDFLCKNGSVDLLNPDRGLSSLTPEVFAEGVNQLERMKIVRRTAENSLVPRTTPSQLSSVLVQSVEKIQCDIALVAELLTTFATTNTPHRPSGLSGIMLVIGAEEHLTRVSGFVAESRHTIDAIAPAIPSSIELQLALPLDSTTLDRGIKVRTIGPVEGRHKPSLLEYVRKTSDLGMEARVSSITPFRLLVFDSERAIIAWREDGEVQSLVIAEPHLVLALQLFFDQLWANSSPYFVEDDVSFALSDSQQVVLSLLADGYSNKAIAKRIGKDERTIRRTIQRLLTLFDVDSVFQLGAEAERRGWL